jgi:hypothetical protein
MQVKANGSVCAKGLATTGGFAQIESELGAHVAWHLGTITSDHRFGHPYGRGLEAAIGYWREVTRQDEAAGRAPASHIGQERTEEAAEHATGTSRPRRGLTLSVALVSRPTSPAG